MEASVCIEQKGIVEEIAGRHIRIRIQRDSTCGHCNARGMCNMGDNSGSIIEITDSTSDLIIGDDVAVSISRTMGNKAIFLGYLVPFILLITVLLVFQALGAREWLTGVCSLLVLVPYFLLLYLFRNRLKKSFNFSVRKNEL